MPIQTSQNKKGSRASSVATPPSAGGPQRTADGRRNDGRDKSQGRGKSNGKGRDRSTSPTHDKHDKQKACKFWAMGKRERENCGYKHVPADEGKKAGQAADAQKEDKRKRSSSRQSKTPCRNFAAGKCTYGDKCIFVHVEAASGKPAAKAAAKAAP